MKTLRAFILAVTMLTLISCNGRVDGDNTSEKPCLKDTLIPIYTLFSRPDFLGQVVELNDSSFMLSANDSLVDRLMTESTRMRKFQVFAQDIGIERRVSSYFFVDSLKVKNDTAFVKISQIKASFDTVSFTDPSPLEMMNKIVIDTLDGEIVVYSPKSIFSYRATFVFNDCHWKFLNKRVTEN